MEDDKRVTKTDIQFTNPVIRDKFLYGIKATVSFTVSRDDEAKKAGEFEQLTGIIWEFDGVNLQNILASAIANERVAWQANLKANWSDFLKADLDGKTYKFGDKPFGTTRTVVQKVTTESALDHIKGLPEEEQRKIMADLMTALQAEYAARQVENE